MAVSKLAVLDVFLDNNANALVGGKIYTYVAGTSTPLATYTDHTGATANTNPIMLDASGRAHVWFTQGSSYKVIVEDVNSVTLYTEDGIAIASTASASTTKNYLVECSYSGSAPPSSSQWLDGHSFALACTFPINFAGAQGHIITVPTASFNIDVKVNGSSVGTVTYSTGGAFSAVTAGGATVAVAAGDRLDFYAPASVDASANELAFTLMAAL